MSIRDPYEVLGVSRSATPEEIKSAFRKLARKHHPDVNPNDPAAEEQFKEIGTAYAVLSDPEKKARFDQYGTMEEMPGDFFSGGGGFQDIFDMFFGGQGGGQRSRRMGRDGQDIRVDLQLTLNHVITGLEQELSVRAPAKCEICDGTGGEGGEKPETCQMCGGQGMLFQTRNTFIGSMRTSTTCPSCHGEGTIVKNPCKTCKGKGLEMREKKVSVRVPPGIESGTTLHVPGRGGEGLGGGHDGDLYVVLRVVDDSRFEREGAHLHTALELTFAQAVLGDELEIEGVDASHELVVPAGTQPGTVLAVRGAGLPPLHGGRRGDILVEVNVHVPSDLSETEARLVRELAELRGERMPKGEPGGILGGMFKRKK